MTSNSYSMPPALTPRSLTLRLGVFFGVLLALPFALYLAFETVDRQKNQLLLRAVQLEGRTVIRGLRDGLAAFTVRGEAPLADELAGFAGDDRNLKLFYRPSGAVSGFFHMASWPVVSPRTAAQERSLLEASGLFGSLTDSCVGGMSLAQRFTNPLGQEELLTSITPLELPNGCWVLLVSHTADAYMGTSLDRPLWANMAVRVAVGGYIVIALLAAWLFWDVRRDLRSIANAARVMRASSEELRPFATQIRTPELSAVSAELDRLVATLATSQKLIRQAAEENAHALKTPIAVIEQALEPLRHTRDALHEDGRRSIDVIGQAVARLDGLVTAARSLDAVVADSLDAAHTALALKPLIPRIVSSFEPAARARNVSLVCEVDDSSMVRGSEELMETVMENLLENALSFSPQGGVIRISAQATGGHIRVAVADDGPGVPENDMELIFERSYSARPNVDSDEPHFGLGLWIVKRNIEAVGGEVHAYNRPQGGLEIEVLLQRVMS